MHSRSNAEFASVCEARAFFRKAVTAHAAEWPSRVNLDGNMGTHLVLRLLRRMQGGPSGQEEMRRDVGFKSSRIPATLVSLSNPSAVAVDYAGNLFIVDLDYHHITRVDAQSGLISTLATEWPCLTERALTCVRD